MKIWIDIENPPQVQYLLPFKLAFAEAGAETVITARDYGSTLKMLENAGIDARVFGKKAGRAKLHKVATLVSRARDLSRFFEASGRPDALLCASRPAAVAARRMRIPSLIISDYEYANASLYGWTGSTILHPEVIDASAFRGISARQLESFKGLKEDLTFAGIDVDAIEPHDFGPVPAGAVRVLFRPPSETSHYYKEASSSMARDTLRRLAQTDALVVFSPREMEQVTFLDGLPWSHPPVVLDRPVPFISLLKSIDAVVCSGGTMLREAAYLGVPAYTILQSKIGGVDRWLQRIGRVEVIAGADDLARLDPKPRGPLQRLDSNPQLIDELVELVMARARAGRERRRAPAFV